MENRIEPTNVSSIATESPQVGASQIRVEVQAILMCVGWSWKQYRFTLKRFKFDPTKRTREQIINDVPQGHTKDNWINLVDYWYSEKCQKLSSIGKEARRSQSHVECKGKEPSHIEFFELTHKKTEGGFVDNTRSSQFMCIEKGGYGPTSSTISNSTQLEIMKARMSDMEKENQELRGLFLQTLQALCSGNISDEVFNGIQSALSKPNSQVASTASGNSTRNGSAELPPSSNS
ncbi:hypothetical protein V2J09_010656 [Rumex salicifolius]